MGANFELTRVPFDGLGQSEGALSRVYRIVVAIAQALLLPDA